MKEKRERNKLIVKMYKKGKTIKEVAEFFNVSYYAVRSILRREKYKLLNGRYLPEGRDFSRELIRKYFNYICQSCGKKWKERQRKFDVHHFSCDPKDSRKYDKERSPDMITLLCHKCHLNLPEHKKKMSEAFWKSTKTIKGRSAKQTKK